MGILATLEQLLGMRSDEDTANDDAGSNRSAPSGAITEGANGPEDDVGQAVTADASSESDAEESAADGDPGAGASDDEFVSDVTDETFEQDT
jgi:hypothetical protein